MPLLISRGRLFALPTNNRLGWKSLPVTYTLTYYEKSKVTAAKSFITLGPGEREQCHLPGLPLQRVVRRFGTEIPLHHPHRLDQQSD
jgi:hypothetical protein